MTPLLGYCEVVDDKAYNEKFTQKSIKYNASLRLWEAFSKTSKILPKIKLGISPASVEKETFFIS